MKCGVWPVTVLGGVASDCAGVWPVTVLDCACIPNLFTVCSDGDLRVVGNSFIEGSLEICINNSYGAICDDFWDEQDARVACMQLGFANGKDEVVTVPVHKDMQLCF